MPIDWANRDTVFRLLAASFAVIGKEGFRGTYGEIARLFGEPATYDAIQSQFREVSKIADDLRVGKAGCQDRQRPARSSKSASRRTRPSSITICDDLGVITQGRGASLFARAQDLQYHGGADGDADASKMTWPRERAKPATPLLSSTSSSEARTLHHHDEETLVQRVLQAPSTMHQAAKHIPQAGATADQISRRCPVYPSSSGVDDVTASFEAELVARAASSAIQPRDLDKGLTQTLLNRAEERGQFRKLYASDSHGTQSEHVDAVLNQSSQEHAAERARYRKLYFPSDDTDRVFVRQEGVSEASSAPPAHDQLGEKHGKPVASAATRKDVADISRFFGKNAAKCADPVDGRSVNQLIQPCKNDTTPAPEKSSSLRHHAVTILAASYMQTSSRKCLLCNRRFPGETFGRHERDSELHRERLRDKDAVARANKKLENMQRQRGEMDRGNKDGPGPAAVECVPKLGIAMAALSRDRDQISQEQVEVSSLDCLSRSLSLPPLRQESSAPSHGQSNRAKGKRSVQELQDTVCNGAATEEQQPIGGTDTGQRASRPLKRKRLVALAPEIGESSSAPCRAAKRARHGDVEGLRDGVLIRISNAVLGTLLELDPGVFDLNSNEQTTPTAPAGRQKAMSPPKRPKSLKEPIRRNRQSHRQTHNDGEEDFMEVDDGESQHPGLHKSSETSKEVFRCSSRCDDSQDEDYQDDGLEEEEEESEDVEEGEEDDEAEDEEL